jgi:alpha-galactosidase
VGWCSWYQYSSEHYTGDLSAQDIRRNLDAMNALRPRLPLEIVQIDDGFEAQVGDWFHFGPSFPDGVAPLASEIHAAGLIPGLWLAPFIVHPRSRLAAEHPDWLLRGRYNRPANAGYLWNSFTMALDLTHSGAIDYAAEVVHTAVHRWGFPYLKLDFLYAAALPGRRRDPTRTRAQALRAGLEALRAAAGEGTMLLGCGCPLGPAIGLVEAMRIGADTARRWNPAFSGIETYIKAEPNLPSARNAIHNALTRAPLHRRWWVNDPDCLLLRPQTRLTLAEVQAAATAISLTGGSLLLSDDLAALPPDRLRIAEVLLPVIDERPRILDWLDAETPRRLRLDLHNASGAWHLLALFNWEDQARDLMVKLEEFDLDPQAGYYAREFWSSELHSVSAGSLPVRQVPAHGVALLAVRPVQEGQPQYLGGDLQISQGLEVAGWQPAPAGLCLSLRRPGEARGHFDLSLPRPPKRAVWEGLPVEWEQITEGCCRFWVSFVGSGSLELEL